ncbi:MAG TPA: Nif11-like leader peptide family natural product precursor [Ramlibacter sp.]|uniref:Nif11-like leader peptide family natural product precursor n=1 Tax=Ramlibacter sp. TaxID=1917967 RepID=UPI002C70B15E|nr:Nif11-like leader peptide family natural product precursor [Ramlibacter sp.]HVZ43762.1 Nif11-like leader peptide family natural product precursor [Ramlibacter sp.]
MSLKAMQDFMNMVADTEALHAKAVDAWARGGMDAVLALGKEHGYEFTPEEVIAVRDAPKPGASPALVALGDKLNGAMLARQNAELTDDELEAVSGGSCIGPQPAPTGPLKGT